MRRFPLAMNVDPTTLYRFVTDLVRSCLASGIRKIVLLNSHGGNDMKPLLRELADKIDGHLFLCNWYTVLSRDEMRAIFRHDDDHAGEMETSFLLAYYPHLVAKTPEGRLAADDGATAPTRFEAINRGWVSITRPWHLLTTNSGAGYPHEASPEKARQLMETLVDRLATFLVQLSAAPLDERFPFA
jgi:creatinine amidohydrolase